MTDRDPLEIIKEEDLVICCIHVVQQKADAEYREEDDGYVCSSCRDKLRDEGFKKMQDFLSLVHRSCLGI